MAFDPDAFLRNSSKKEFDPDEFIRQAEQKPFDPDAFIRAYEPVAAVDQLKDLRRAPIARGPIKGPAQRTVAPTSAAPVAPVTAEDYLEPATSAPPPLSDAVRSQKAVAEPFALTPEDALLSSFATPFQQPKPASPPTKPKDEPRTYKNRGEALDDAVNLLEEGFDQKQVIDSFSKLGVSWDEIIKHGKARQSEYFRAGAPLPVEQQRRGMEALLRKPTPPAELKAAPEPGLVQGAINALKRGKANISDLATNMMYESRLLSPEEAGQIIARNAKQRSAAAPSYEAQKGMEAIGNAKTYGDAAQALYDNPLATFTMLTDSVIQTIPGLAALAVSAPLGGLARVATAFGTSGTMEYAGVITDVLQENGVDLMSAQDVAKALRNPKLVQEMNDKGLQRGLAVGVFDALTAGLAGRFMDPAQEMVAASKLAGKQAKKVTAAAWAKELSVQMAGGAAGEAVAQKLTGEERPADVILEALAEGVTAPVDVLSALSGRDVMPGKVPPVGGVVPPEERVEPTVAAEPIITPERVEPSFGAEPTVEPAVGAAPEPVIPGMVTTEMLAPEAVEQPEGRVAPDEPATPPAAKAAVTPVQEPSNETAAVGMAVQEVPLRDLTLSKDVPQFKMGADAKGVVEPLGGKFERTGVAPIQVWRRLDGSLEVISGRHRLDLARRSGEKTIPAQIHDESQGFTTTMAAILDAELNIRDGQGKVKDYVNYFKASGITSEDAESRGLLARSTGKRAYTIATTGSDELVAAVRNDQVGDEAAYYIALNAPNDPRLQSVGMQAVMDGKSANLAVNTMNALKALGVEQDTTTDMFGFDDSAMKEAAAMAQVANKKQREIQTRLAAITGAAKNPAVAKAEGIDIRDPEAVNRRIGELRQMKAAWDNWATSPELIGEIRQARGVEAPGLTLRGETEAEIRAREEAAAAEEQRLRSEADAARRAEQAEVERKRAEETTDLFQLGQTAEQQMSGMGDLFAAPVVERPEAKPAPQKPAAKKEAKANEYFVENLGETLPFPDIIEWYRLAYRNMEQARDAYRKGEINDEQFLDQKNEFDEIKAEVEKIEAKEYRKPKVEAPEAAEEKDLFGQPTKEALKAQAKELMQNKVRIYASGMSSIGDLSRAGSAAGGLKLKGVGVDVGELSANAINMLAHTAVTFDGALFVDSGAFGAFRRGLKSGTITPINFDNVLKKYDAIIDAIGQQTEEAGGDWSDVVNKPMFVMPDVVGDQTASLQELKKHLRWVKTELRLNHLQLIVPLQRGDLSLSDAYKAIVDMLGTDNFVVGIPSNAAAITPQELEAFLSESKPKAIHILGAGSEKNLLPRLISAINAGVADTTTITADASPIRSAVLNAVASGMKRGDAIEKFVFDERDPSLRRDLEQAAQGVPPAEEPKAAPKPTKKPARVVSMTERRQAQIEREEEAEEEATAEESRVEAIKRLQKEYKPLAQKIWGAAFEAKRVLRESDFPNSLQDKALQRQIEELEGVISIYNELSSQPPLGADVFNTLPRAMELVRSEGKLERLEELTKLVAEKLPKGAGKPPVAKPAEKPAEKRPTQPTFELGKTNEGFTPPLLGNFPSVTLNTDGPFYVGTPTDPVFNANSKVNKFNINPERNEHTFIFENNKGVKATLDIAPGSIQARVGSKTYNVYDGDMSGLDFIAKLASLPNVSEFKSKSREERAEILTAHIYNKLSIPIEALQQFNLTHNYVREEIAGTPDNKKVEENTKKVQQFYNKTFGPAATKPAEKLPYTKEQREDAEVHAKEVGGEIAWQRGEYALIRGYSVLTGDPVYAPTIGSSRARVDISSFTGKQIPDDVKKEMLEAKERLEKEAAEAHDANPFIKFKDGIALSEDIPANLAGVIRGWKDLLKLDVPIYVSTLEAAKSNRDKFTGPHRRIGSGTLDENERGSMRRMSDGSYYILFERSTSPSLMLETIAHEMGHVHQRLVYEKASDADKSALQEAHKRWLESQKGKTAKELVEALRTRATGRQVKGRPNLMAEDLTSYWKSFSEWYADQTARWAVSAEAPVSVVEKFFKRLGNQLRRFYQSLRGQKYLPDETFREFIERAISPTYMGPSDATLPSSDEAQQQLRDMEEPGTFNVEEPSYAGLTTDRVSRLLSAYAYPRSRSDTKAFVAYVNPNDFADAATRPEDRAILEEQLRPLDIEEMAGLEGVVYLKGTWSDDFKQFIPSEHDGRHRILALRDAGVMQVPVVFVSYDRIKNAQVIDSAEVTEQRWGNRPLNDIYRRQYERDVKGPRRKVVSYEQWLKDTYDFTLKDAAEFHSARGISGFKITNAMPVSYDMENRLMLEFGGQESEFFFNIEMPGMPDTIKVDGKDRPTRNSEGRPIHSTEQGIRNFWRWFGDSKVVAAKDKPQVMYHVSKVPNIAQFDPRAKTDLSSMGFHFGTKEQAQFRATQFDFAGDATLGEYYLSIKNPLRVTHMGSFAPDHLADQMMDMGLLDESRYEKIYESANYDQVKIGDKLVNILKKAGYDGLVYENEREGEGDSYVPFEPTQIKSATGNLGAFAPTEPSIIADIESTKPTKRMSDEDIRDEQIREYSALRQRLAAVPRRIAAGKSALPDGPAEGMTELERVYLKALVDRAQDLKAAIKISAPRLDSPEQFLARALKEYDAGNISKEVLDVIQAAYKQQPGLLNGLKLSIKQAPEGAGRVAGAFLNMSRIVRLYKGSSGVDDPKTIRHELTHSLEQMMTPEQRGVIIDKWQDDLAKAIRKHKDAAHQKYFEALLKFLDKPTMENYKAAIAAMPSYDMYQFINPSEYWAVNAESLMASQLGGHWQRFKAAMKRMFEALKDLFGFDNKYVVHRAFKDIMTGSKERVTTEMLADLAGIKVQAQNVPSGRWPANTRIEVTKQQADEFWKAAEKIKRSEGVEDAEDAWSGGIADFGDKDAAFMLFKYKGASEYQEAIQNLAFDKFIGGYDKMSYNTKFYVYRYGDLKLVNRVKRNTIKSDEPVSTSLSLGFVKAFPQFAGFDETKPGVKRGWMRIAIDPNAIWMLGGKPSEQELVINAYTLAPDDIEIIDESFVPEEPAAFFNIEEDKALIEKYKRPKTPMLDKKPLATFLLDQFKNGKDLFKDFVENPKGAAADAGNSLIDGALRARMATVWYGAGLESRDFAKYGGQLRTSEDLATASVALDNAIRSGNIGVEVIFRGGLKFDNSKKQLVAVETKKGMRGVYEAERRLKDKLGNQLGTDIIQGYLEAKRSISIMNEFYDRQAAYEGAKENLKMLREQGASEKKIKEAVALMESAERSLESVKKAVSSVTMTEDEMYEFAARDKVHPELREIMDNWTAVNQNLLRIWRDVGLLSPERYEALASIPDYVPWYRIMQDEEDPHTPLLSTTRGLTNIGREKLFKRTKPTDVLDFKGKEGKKVLDESGNLIGMSFKVPPSTVLRVEVDGEKIKANDLSITDDGRVMVKAPIDDASLVVFKVTRPIQNIVDNMTQNVMRMTMNAIRQYAAGRIVSEYATRDPQGRVMTFPKEDLAKGRFSFVINGQRKVVEISDPLPLGAIYGMDSLNLKMYALPAAFANFFRRTITLSFVFQLKQVFKDAPTAAAVTGVRNPAALILGTYKGLITALLQPVGKKVGIDIEPVVNILKAAGIGGFQNPSRTPEAEVKRRLGIMNRNVFDFVIQALDHIGDSADMAQRIAVYKRVMAETGNETQALYQAANVINFLHHGSSGIAQALVKTSAFMGAYANAMDVLVNSLIGGGLKGMSRRKAIARLSVTTGMLIGITLLYTMLVSGDDDYEELDDQTKLRNFIIPGTDIMLPMNTSYAFFWKAITEMLYNEAIKKATPNEIDQTRLKKALSTAARDMLLGPEPVPQIIKGPVEIAIGYNFFTGRDIIPEGLKNVEAFQQYTATTSELGKWLSSYTEVPGTDGKRILNPIEADHLIRSTFGTAGALGQWVTNRIAVEAGTRPELTEKETPITGAFLRPEVDRGREDLFYDLRDRVNQKYNTLRELERDDEKRAEAYDEKYEDLLDMHKEVNKIAADLSDINAEIRELSTSKDIEMTPAERRAEIRALQQEKKEVLDDIYELRKEAGL